MRVFCQYCDQPAALRTGAQVYPHRPEHAGKRFWVCDPCEARVGCHSGTDKPLGNLADEKLRAARQLAHDTFDPIWRLMATIKKGSQIEIRATTKRWLALQLHIPAEECHFASMPYEDCLRSIALCKALLTELQGKYGTSALFPAPIDVSHLDEDIPV